MWSYKRRLTVVALFALVMCLGTAAYAGVKGVMLWDFENVAPGKLPVGWKVETTGRVSQPATWEVVVDSNAPSGTHVLSLTRVNHHSWGAFNLCWTNAVAFRDGEITVRFRADSGRIDQGGGIMWRVKDRNNYYVARFNPLEDNFRIYYVKNGDRHLVKSAHARFPRGQWVTMKVVQRGDRFQCYLNGKMLLSGTIGVFHDAGGVGLWTKSDAATSFDDFSVRLPVH